MSNGTHQQRMHQRPSGHKSRVYKYAGFWWADRHLDGDPDEYRTSLHNSQAQAFQQAIRYAKGEQ